jgi:glycosyltransferase involved in cell wall biosynthesis
MTYIVSDISVLITCYREGDLLLRAMESVGMQSVQGFEVIIINDCSPDARTNQICRDLEQQGITVIFRTSNGGLSEARNTGFQSMKGKIAMPLDADDTLPENAVFHTLEAFNNYPDADMVFGDYLLINEHGERVRTDCSVLVMKNNTLDPEKLARNWKLMGQSPCTRNLWKNIGGYDINFSNTVQDVDFWRRAMLTEMTGKYVPELLYHWYRTDQGMNNSVTEAQYLPLRLASLPFYDRFHPEYGIHIRNYIYRYYASRLLHSELNVFVSKERAFFSTFSILKAKIMRLKLLYMLLRKTNNLFR